MTNLTLKGNLADFREISAKFEAKNEILELNSRIKALEGQLHCSQSANESLHGYNSQIIEMNSKMMNENCLLKKRNFDNCQGFEGR